MRVTLDHCGLEIDFNRGVIYVHNPKGFTALRISGLSNLMSSVPDNINPGKDNIQIDIAAQDPTISITKL